MYTSMIPPYLHSVMPQLDLNEDQNPDQLSSPTGHHTSSSFSSLSSSYPILLDPSDHVQQYEIKHLPNDQEEVEKIIIPSSGSWDYSTAENHDSNSSKHRLKIRWKKEQSDHEVHNIQETDKDGSVKWMSSKMRMMKKMMVSDQTTDSHIPKNSKQKFEDQKQPLSPLGTDNSSCSNNNSNNSSNSTIRVCSDCHTTKTPLWRSGPKGPKTLCNACGIRQRKARRALALAAASANGTAVVVADDQKTSVKRKKLQKKDNKTKIECSTNMKKKLKLDQAKTSQSRKEFSFEDLILTLSLNKNLDLQQVFPQDEKEAAILLMALSYGLVHG